MIQPAEIWVATAALLALQIGAFTWRIGREIEVAEKLGDINWLPLADRMNLAAMTSSLAVFIFSLLTRSAVLPQGAFLVSVALSMGYPFAVASHYDLWCEGKRDYERGKRHERMAVGITFAFALIVLSVFITFAGFSPRCYR
jgi:hypothetical protein